MNKLISSQPTPNHAPLPVQVMIAETVASVPVDTIPQQHDPNRVGDYLGATMIIGAVALAVAMGRKSGHSTPQKDAQQADTIEYAGRNSLELKDARISERKAARKRK